MRPPLATGLAALYLSDSALYIFTAALQGVVAAGVRMAVPPPAPSSLAGEVVTLSLLHLRFECGWQWMGTYLPFGRRPTGERGGWRG